MIYKNAMCRLGLFLVLALSQQAWASTAPPQCSPGAPSVHCGKTPSAAFKKGILWVVFEQNNHLYVVQSKDQGKHFSPAVRVNDGPETIETNGENRPKIAITDKAVVISWTRKTAGRFTGDIRFARSVDGGKTFASPRTINDDGQMTSHRFDSLLALPDGTVYIAWLDKRNKLKAEKEGQAYSGSGLFYAVSTDHGKSFSQNYPIADHSCECCRIAAAPAGAGNLAIFWRHIVEQSRGSPGTRDHAFAVVTPKGVTETFARATFDDWQIDACPHHGPDITPSATGGYHLAWFTDGKQRQGVIYGFRDSANGETGRIVTMDPSPGASHPQVKAIGQTVFYAWKQFNGEVTQVYVAQSNDNGQSWSEARVLASTQGSSDHPLLVASRDAVYLSWHTQAEGYRTIEVYTEGGRRL
jgi:hypothetical protein